MKLLTVAVTGFALAAGFSAHPAAQPSRARPAAAAPQAAMADTAFKNVQLL